MVKMRRFVVRDLCTIYTGSFRDLQSMHIYWCRRSFEFLFDSHDRIFFFSHFRKIRHFFFQPPTTRWETKKTKKRKRPPTNSNKSNNNFPCPSIMIGIFMCTFRIWNDGFVWKNSALIIDVVPTLVISSGSTVIPKQQCLPITWIPLNSSLSREKKP